MTCYGHKDKKEYCPYEEQCEAEKINVSTYEDYCLGNYIMSKTDYCIRDDKKGAKNERKERVF